MAMMQQWQKIRQQGHEDPKPRQQMLDGLTAFMKPNKEARNKILIILDANNPINSASMDRFMDNFNLCDLMLADFLPLTPPKTLPPWTK
jgi:hypothetical protein